MISPYELAVVCCQHGDEVFGKTVYDYLLDNPEYNGLVRPVFGNRRAYETGVSHIDHNLNRCYGDQPDLEGYEPSIAPVVLSEARMASLMLDIHTTVADIEHISIIAKLNDATRFILSHVNGDIVAFMESAETRSSLIGNHDGGVALEFNEDFARDEGGLDIVTEVIDGILTNTTGPHTTKNLYRVAEIMGMESTVPDTVQNGEYVAELGGYVLMPRASDYRGFLSPIHETVNIAENL